MSKIDPEAILTVPPDPSEDLAERERRVWEHFRNRKKWNARFATMLEAPGAWQRTAVLHVAARLGGYIHPATAADDPNDDFMGLGVLVPLETRVPVGGPLLMSPIGGPPLTPHWALRPTGEGMDAAVKLGEHIKQLAEACPLTAPDPSTDFATQPIATMTRKEIAGVSRSVADALGASGTAIYDAVDDPPPLPFPAPPRIWPPAELNPMIPVQLCELRDMRCIRVLFPLKAEDGRVYQSRLALVEQLGKHLIAGTRRYIRETWGTDWIVDVDDD